MRAFYALRYGYPHDTTSAGSLLWVWVWYNCRLKCLLMCGRGRYALPAADRSAEMCMPPVAPQPVQIQCPACGTPFRAAIYTLLDVSNNPQLSHRFALQCS